MGHRRKRRRADTEGKVCPFDGRLPMNEPMGLADGWPISTGSYNAPVDRPDRPLRILHLTAHSEPGGLSRYIYDLSLAMHQAGHDVRVAGNRGSGHRMFEGAPFPYIELPLDQGPLQMWRAARALRRHLREHPADVIHSHYRRTNWIG